jgi:hypothetical protein
MAMALLSQRIAGKASSHGAGMSFGNTGEHFAMP